MTESEVFLSRTVIGVIGLDTEEGLVDVDIMGWRKDDGTSGFPTIPAFRLMRAGLLEKALESGAILAKVNLAAETEEDLMFQEFEEAPLPIIELAFSNP